MDAFWVASLLTVSACNNLATGHSIWLLQFSTHRTPVHILNTLRFLDVRSVVGADYYFNIFIATLCCYCLLVVNADARSEGGDEAEATEESVRWSRIKIVSGWAGTLSGLGECSYIGGAWVRAARGDGGHAHSNRDKETRAYSAQTVSATRRVIAQARNHEREARVWHLLH